MLWNIQTGEAFFIIMWWHAARLKKIFIQEWGIIYWVEIQKEFYWELKISLTTVKVVNRGEHYDNGIVD